jgi:hypothetical protein
MADPRPHIILREMTLDDVDLVYSLDKLSFPTPWPLRTYRYEVEDNEHSRMLVLEPVGALPVMTGLVSVLRARAGVEEPLRVVGFAGVAAMEFGLFLLSYAVLTPGKVPWRAHLPGALLMTAGWELLKLLGGVFLASYASRARRPLFTPSVSSAPPVRSGCRHRSDRRSSPCPP